MSLSMRRMILLLTVVALMVVMLAMSAAPAFAAKSETGEYFSRCAKDKALVCASETPGGNILRI